MADTESNKSHSIWWIAFVGLLILHQDVWLWDSQRVVFGLPIGMTYHVGFSIVVAIVFSLALKYAWPAEVEASAEKETNHAATEDDPVQ